MDRSVEEYLDALRMMASLDQLTLESLPKPPPVPPLPSKTTPFTSPTPTTTPVQYETSKREYEPALKDDSLITALLEFQKSIESPPLRQKNSQTPSTQEAEKTESAFQFPKLDELEINLKGPIFKNRRK